MFVVAALVHGALAKATTEKRIELVLVYLLVGYQGIVMLAVAVFALVAGEHPIVASEMSGTERMVRKVRTVPLLPVDRNKD